MELRKVRDFGENINDTFQFIKQEFKPLLKSFLAISGVLILLTGVVSALYQQDTMRDIINALKGVQYRAKGLDEIFTPTYFMFIFLSSFNVVVMRVVLAVYVKLYDTTGGVSPTIEEVWKEVIRFVVPVFLYSFVLLILIIIAACFCLAPGLYLLIVFAPVNFIFVIENASLGEAFNRCFALIKDNFWFSIGLYIVVYLIYAVSSSIIGVAISSVAGLIAYFTTKDIASVVGVVTAILSVFQYVFYIIFSVSVALHYFNLVEQKDGEGLMRRIDGLGSETTDSSKDEQY